MAHAAVRAQPPAPGRGAGDLQPVPGHAGPAPGPRCDCHRPGRTRPGTRGWWASWPPAWPSSTRCPTFMICLQEDGRGQGLLPQSCGGLQPRSPPWSSAPTCWRASAATPWRQGSPSGRRTSPPSGTRMREMASAPTWVGRSWSATLADGRGAAQRRLSSPWRRWRGCPC